MEKGQNDSKTNLTLMIWYYFEICDGEKTVSVFAYQAVDNKQPTDYQYIPLDNYTMAND